MTKLSNHMSMFYQTGGVRVFEQTVPFDHKFSDILAPGYFNACAVMGAGQKFKPGDRITLTASDQTWMAEFVVVTSSSSARMVIVRMLSLMFLLVPLSLFRKSDVGTAASEGALYLTDESQRLDMAWHGSKITKAEWEERVAWLKSLREVGWYSSRWLASKLMELNEALDAGYLTRGQHHAATQELNDVMDGEEQAREVGDIVNILTGGGAPPEPKPRPKLVKKGAPPASPASH